jgi:heme exporter protein B
MNAAAPYFTILHRDLKLALRRRTTVLNPLVFFVIAVTLFPLSVGPEPNLLLRIAPGVVWVGALLSAMLSLEAMFHADHDDGSLEQMLVSPHALPLLALAKVTAHWLVTGLPAILLAPVLGGLLRMPGEAIAVLMLSLALGTPILSLVGAVGAALTCSQRQGGTLVSLLILPLYIPVLIFGAGAVDQAGAGLSFESHLSLLGAMLALALTLTPWAVAAALRIATE